jgi:hypothetical protein
MVNAPIEDKWYVAELVQEFAIEGEQDNVIHCDMLLIHANSPEAAYDEAIRFGAGDATYTNPEGKTVTARFRGLKSLHRMWEEPHHGALVSWEKRTGMSETELQAWLPSKKELDAFKPEAEEAVEDTPNAP